MAGVAPVNPKFTFSEAPSGTLDVYLAGTTTRTTTWQDRDQVTANENPIALNSRGECSIYLDPDLTYKFVLKNAGGVTLWTQDNINGAEPAGLRADLAADSGSSLVSFLDSGTSAVSIAVQTLLRSAGVNVFSYLSEVELADVMAFGGAVDVSTAVQAAFDAAGLTSAEYFATTDDYRRSKKKVFVPDGTYLVGDLSVYQGTTIEWGPKAVFKLKSGATCAIKSVNYQGQTNPNFGVERVCLIRPRIDMNGNGTFGMLLQGLTNSLVYMPEIINVPSGTALYNDGFANSLYDKAGIALKGIDGVIGAYWNTIYMPRIKGVSGGGNNGIWMGTSSTGANQRANHNRIIAPYCETLARGVQIMGGGDNYIELPEASLCDIGIAIGLTTGTVPCKRNHIKIPYLENCSVSGIRLSSNASDTIIDGIGSTSGTTTPINDSGVNTEFKAANSDTYTSGFARFYRYGLRFGTAVDGADKETNANTLDDYQEGTFTPVIEGGTSAGTGTYTTQTGDYTLIGNRCLFNISIVYTGHTGTGNFRITGLPFTSETGVRTYPAAIYTSDIAATASNEIKATVMPNTKRIDLFNNPVGGGSATNLAIDTGGGTIHITGSYLVNH